MNIESSVVYLGKYCKVVYRTPDKNSVKTIYGTVSKVGSDKISMKGLFYEKDLSLQDILSMNELSGHE